MTIKHMRGPATIALASALTATALVGSAEAATAPAPVPAQAQAQQAQDQAQAQQKKAWPAYIAVRKYASRDVVKVGHYVTYTLKVKNLGWYFTRNASFWDNLKDVHHHARIVGRVHASRGHVYLRDHKLIWVGSLWAKQEATVKFTVKTRRTGRMTNVVHWDGKKPGWDRTRTRIVPRHIK
ncbi:DUF11 domain-containing protein [Actinomadura atramentaria]|uniref:DUF7927 domain-containing protein n=1 Tax=Actinomadura atramentaria TaxID=1990 RepID=UPI00037446D7|nr:DUF11 domain-containing protein [Actinomadura atramentaria]